MTKPNYTRQVFKIHKWIGLFAGLFLLLLGVSGSILIFKDEIDHAVNKQLLTVQQGNEKIPLDSAYKIITNQYPNLDGIGWQNPDAKENEAYDFRLYENDGKLFTYDLSLISIDPYTGHILREGKMKDVSTGLIHWIYQFHFSFQLGLPGAALTAVFGLIMLISIITGILIYRKHLLQVFLFQVRLKNAQGKISGRKLHRIVGVWSLLFNSIIFFTGFWLNLFAFDSAAWKTELQPSPLNTRFAGGFDTMLIDAKKAFPELIVTYVRLPVQKGKMLSVAGTVPNQSAFFAGGNSVLVDPLTKKVVKINKLQDQPFEEKLEDCFFALHTGRFGGLPMKILYILIGLTPALLSITGFMLLWKRK